MGDLGRFLLQKLLEVCPLRSQPRGKGTNKALFPLPTSRELLLELKPDLSVAEIDWVVCVCLSLNSLWGCNVAYRDPPNAGQKRCLWSWLPW